MKEFNFGGKVTAIADPKMNNATAKKLWSSFCYGDSELLFSDGADCTFRIGEEKLPVLGEG